MSKSNYLLKIFFIILFLAALFIAFFSENFSYLPKEFNFKAVIYLLIPSVLLTNNKYLFGVQATKRSEQIIDSTFMFLFVLTYILYVINLFIVYFQIF